VRIGEAFEAQQSSPAMVPATDGVYVPSALRDTLPFQIGRKRHRPSGHFHVGPARQQALADAATVFDVEAPARHRRFDSFETSIPIKQGCGGLFPHAISARDVVGRVSYHRQKVCHLMRGHPQPLPRSFRPAPAKPLSFSPPKQPDVFLRAQRQQVFVLRENGDLVAGGDSHGNRCKHVVCLTSW